MEEIVEMEIITMEIIMVDIQVTMAAIQTMVDTPTTMVDIPTTTADIQHDQHIDRTITVAIQVTEMEDIQTIITGIQVMAMADIQAMVMEDIQITTIIMDTLETALGLREVIKSKMSL